MTCINASSGGLIATAFGLKWLPRPGPPLGWGRALLVWGYALARFLVNDREDVRVSDPRSRCIACRIAGMRKDLMSYAGSAGLVAIAAICVASMASCSLTRGPGTAFPAVDAYKIQDLLPPHKSTPASGKSSATEPEDDGDAFPTGLSRIGIAQEALQALATHRGRSEDVDILALTVREFERFDPAYLSHQALREKRLDTLKRELIANEKSGRALPCSRRMMIEAEWLLDYTARWSVLDQKLAAIAQSLANKDQGFALRQAPDGSWGRCYDAWFEKVSGSIDVLDSMRFEAGEQAPALQYRFDILRPIDSSETLISYLSKLQISTIARTGIYQREELAAVEGALSQFLFKAPLRAVLRANGAAFIDQAYVDGYRRFLDDTQDPVSGYWGPWIMANGEIIRTADLSQTFHAISYRKGAVNDWPQIIKTTLAIKDFSYPFGWMHNGHYNNHNDYDVVTILRFGWPRMTPAERDLARKDIRDMLEWTLEESVAADGQFWNDPSFYDSVSEAYYYGVAFLDEVGYWNEDRRFWENDAAAYAGAKDLCRKIRVHLAKMQTNSMAAQDALTRLDDGCPPVDTH